MFFFLRLINPNQNKKVYTDQTSQNNFQNSNDNSLNSLNTDNVNSNTSNFTNGLTNGNNSNIQHNKEIDNQLFDNILRDVIHVSTNEHRINVNSDSSIQVQDIPFKITGLNEPTINQLVDYSNLGVVAPLSVLSAQPPFYNDIKLISSFAQEANACINNYTLQVPQNVAFNFNPVA